MVNIVNISRWKHLCIALRQPTHPDGGEDPFIFQIKRIEHKERKKKLEKKQEVANSDVA